MDNKLSKLIGTRINTLLAKNGKRQKDLAQYLGVKDNTISYFISGTRTPNTEQIKKIATFFNTSADYLLGMCSEPSNDKDVLFVCDYTGLSSGAVDELRESNKIMVESEYKVILSDFIEQQKLSILIANCVEYRKQVNKLTELQKKDVNLACMRDKLQALCADCTVTSDERNELQEKITAVNTEKKNIEAQIADTAKECKVFLFSMQEIVTEYAKYDCGRSRELTQTDITHCIEKTAQVCGGWSSEVIDELSNTIFNATGEFKQEEGD